MDATLTTPGLKGKRVLVTGGTVGIGLATAKGFVENGAHVAILARHKEGLEATASQLGNGTVWVQGDLRKPTELKPAIEEAVHKLGGLDVLIVNGAASGGEYLGPDESKMESYQFLYEIHVLSTQVIIESCIGELLKNGGSVVVVSSMGIDAPYPPTSPFNCAKAAETQLMKDMALRYAEKGVRFNAVMPGCVHVPALDNAARIKGFTLEDYLKLRASTHPMNRCGKPEEVANAILFLASPLSAWMTGECLRVDGGLSLTSWFNSPMSLAGVAIPRGC